MSDSTPIIEFDAQHIPEAVPRILIFVLTTYERTGWVQKDLAQFLIGLRENMAYATQIMFIHNSIPAAGARNYIGRLMCSAKGTLPDWVCMIDNDMAPPANLLDTIKAAPADAAVAVPAFHLWDGDERRTKLCWGMDDRQVAAIRGCIDPGKFYPLTKCGTGVIFIRPKLFRKVPAPWFWYTYNEDMHMTSTEDINFALKAREHGLKLYGKGGIVVGHHHTVDLALVDKIQQQVRKAQRELDEARAEIAYLKKAAPAEYLRQGLDNGSFAGSDLARSQDPSESPSSCPVLAAAVSPTE